MYKKTSFEQYQKRFLVPWVGIEPTLPKELDFESSASTNSATKAFSQLDCKFIKKNELQTFLLKNIEVGS